MSDELRKRIGASKYDSGLDGWWAGRVEKVMIAADRLVEAVEKLYGYEWSVGDATRLDPLMALAREYRKVSDAADLNKAEHDMEAHYVQDPDNFVLSEGCPACLAIAAQNRTSGQHGE